MARKSAHRFRALHVPVLGYVGGALREGACFLMAITVISGYSYILISDCNSDSSQGTHNGLDTQDTEYYRFGSASLCGIFKSTSNTHTFTPTQAVDLSGTGVHVRWQMVLNQGALLKTYANNGVNFWASDGQIHYAIEVGFLRQLGTWKYQAYVKVMSGQEVVGSWHSSVSSFTVIENIID